MKRKRVATWVAIASLGLLCGCQSYRNGCCEGGLMSRLGLRKNHGNGEVVLPGAVVGAPGSGGPFAPGVEGYPGSVPEGPILDGAPPIITTIPGGTLPPPTPLGTGAPPLHPVPNGARLAPETPAPPSSPTSRRR